jgi:bromodomain-containing factor 1
VSAPLHFTPHRISLPFHGRFAYFYLALLLLTYLSEHDPLFEDPIADASPTEHLAQPKTSINGSHTATDTSASAPAVEPAIEPTTHVSSGIDGIAQYMPDSQQDTNSLFGDSDMGVTVGQALEAPTSDLRDEPATAEELSTAKDASAESTQQVPETQFEPKDESSLDAMDISLDMSEDSKLPESSAPPTKPMHDLSIHTGSDGTAVQPISAQSPAIVDRDMEDAPASGKVRPREDDEDEVPDAKRTKTEDESNGPVDFKVPDVPTHADQPNGNGVSSAPGSSSAQEPSGVHNAVDFEEWPTTPMTSAQNKFLLERIRNTKKIKVSLAFKDPVDHIALNIPTYPEIVTRPMDLSTMENKLKENKYTYVREFMGDLDQMIVNSELFNNKQHPVTQAGYNLRAYFLKGMGKMPRGSSAEDPPKPVKAKKPTVNTGNKARRESRVAMPTVKSPAGPTPTAASPSAAWPLQDGVPVIRRDSSSANDRPKREIHRPSKDLPYASTKPRKKKYQQELKFCESVLAELLKPKYAAVSYPFVSPVDPVALNIPSYLKIIKKPMDFGTIEKNLKAGVYQSSKDFYNDAQLVFGNCYKFNPEGDAVNKMGHDLENIFEALWKEKSAWLATHAPTQEQSPVYSDEDDEDDEEEEEEVDPAQAQFLAIQQQIAALNETAQALLQQQKGGKRASPKAAPKKKKPVKTAPSVPLSVPPPVKPGRSSKPRPKAPAPLTFTQKQEISEGISTLGDADMRKAVQIIRNGCPHLANVHDDEMELDMDEINDDTLRELFKFIKSIRGPKGGVIADDDFEPPRQITKQTTSRPKKNKPMGKTEQEDNMRKIQEKLQSFQGGASGSSQSPAGELSVCVSCDSRLTFAAHDASSDDDESSGSESEEE